MMDNVDYESTDSLGLELTLTVVSGDKYRSRSPRFHVSSLYTGTAQDRYNSYAGAGVGDCSHTHSNLKQFYICDVLG